MKYISLGIFTLNILFLPLSSIMNSVKYTVIELLDQKREEIVKPSLDDKKFDLLFYNFFMGISKIISGLGYIYIFCRTQWKRKEKLQENNSIRYSNQSSLRPKMKKKMLLVKSYYKRGKIFIALIIFITSTIDIIVTLSLVYLAKNYGYIGSEDTDTDKDQYVSILDFKLISIQILYLCGIKHIFKSNINYYHHFLSYVLIFVGILFAFIPGIEQEINLDFKIPSYCAIYILVVLQSLLEKWVMDMKYIKVHLLLFLEGWFTTCICLIIGFIFDLVDPTTFFGSALKTFEATLLCFQHGMMFLYFLISLAASSLYYLSMMITRYHYTPTHCAVADVLSVFFSWIMLLATGMIAIDWFYFFLIGFVLIIIGAVIYNEIVVLHFCLLDENTIPEIRERSTTEFNESVCQVNELEENIYYIEMGEFNVREDVEVI